ncbi:MAG: glycoside hydrolase family 88 protein [Tannerella sp.]|jgi:rhamnogalacturonyl hydrolase YesR|nr:glycoside hydrolase family 88 protein [Tannerella sp.]
MKHKLVFLLTATCALCHAQPWPRESRFTVDNTRRITDESVSLYNLHSDYAFPYVIPSREDVAEKLTRIANFLEGATAKEIVDPATGRAVIDFNNLPRDFILGKGDFRPYSYEWGVTYNGMLMAAAATGNSLFSTYVATRMRLLARALPAVDRYLAADGDYCSPLSSAVRPHDLDACGALCAAAIRVHGQGADFDLRPLIDRWLDFISLKQHRLADGTLARNTPYANTLWLDDMYMAIPTLAGAYRLTGRKEYLDDAVRQTLSYARRMLVPATNLFMHGYVEAMEPHPALYWGRANGWAILAIADLLDVLPENHPRYKEVLDVFRNHCRGLLQCQSGRGLWYQLLDRSDSYPESSCTAMFVYGLVHGINKGWLDARVFGPAALLGWNALSEQINNMGQIENVCVGTGIAFDPAYYYHRRVHPYTAHGYGPVLMAGSEIILLTEHFNIEQNTTIFFYDRK